MGTKSDEFSFSSSIPFKVTLAILSSVKAAFTRFILDCSSSAVPSSNRSSTASLRKVSSSLDTLTFSHCQLSNGEAFNLLRGHLFHIYDFDLKAFGPVFAPYFRVDFFHGILTFDCSNLFSKGRLQVRLSYFSGHSENFDLTHFRQTTLVSVFACHISVYPRVS